MLAGLSASGAHGTLIQIVDPAEETFPYVGPRRIRRAGRRSASSPPAAPRAGPATMSRASPLHRDEIRSETNKLDWLFSTHTTSRSAAELLLFLHSGMMASQGQRARLDRQSGAQRMIAGLPSDLCTTAAAAGPVEPAGVVVAAARDAAAAEADRVSADAAAVRHQAEGRNPVADAVVADPAAAGRRRAGHPRRRRPDLESANRRRRQQRAAGDPARRRLERGGKLGHPRSRPRTN